MNKHLKLSAALLAAVLVLAAGGNFAFGQTATPPVATPPAGPRAGRGAGRQPHMEMALMRLRNAHTDLESALPDKGGNREKAIHDVEQAASSVEAGIKYAEDHAEEFGRGARGARGAAARGATPATAPTPSTPVTTPGTFRRQPQMDKALNRLRTARTDLEAALPDKGGNREKAIQDIDQAIHSVEAGIKYADEHAEEFPQTGRGARGTGVATAPASRQPHMDAALARLHNAHEDLVAALPDKGGHREQAIKDIDQAIKSVEEGIAYADAHPEEFPGGRRGGPGRGAATPPPTTSTGTTTTTGPNLILAPAGG
jgi:hypothetical protein